MYDARENQEVFDRKVREGDGRAGVAGDREAGRANSEPVGTRPRTVKPQSVAAEVSGARPKRYVRAHERSG
jgi:hypothetical protein